MAEPRCTKCGNGLCFRGTTLACEGCGMPVTDPAVVESVTKAIGGRRADRGIKGMLPVQRPVVMEKAGRPLVEVLDDGEHVEKGFEEPPTITKEAAQRMEKNPPQLAPNTAHTYVPTIPSYKKKGK